MPKVKAKGKSKDSSQDGSDAANSSDVKELCKKKSRSQAAFTRLSNSVERLLADEKFTISVMTTNLEELEERYKKFEFDCEAILEVVDENEDLFKDVNDILVEKYELLNVLRNELSVKSGENSNDIKTSNDQFSMIQTEDLIKSFKASMTLPKPNFTKYDGNPAEYSSFIAYLETYVEPNVDNDRQCLSFLIDSCSGIAYEAISFLSQCKNSQNAYNEAKTILKDLFGRKHLIVRSVIDECCNGPQIKANDIQALRKLAISMRKAEITLVENNSHDDLTATDRLIRIHQRLPKHLQYKWSDKVFDITESHRKPSLVDMRKLVEFFVFARDNEYNTDIKSDNAKVSASSSKGSKPVFAISEKPSIKCLMCNGSHYLNLCKTFIAMSVHDRLDFVKAKKLCFNCLHGNHCNSKCKRNSLCKQCIKNIMICCIMKLLSLVRNQMILHPMSFMRNPVPLVQI